MRIWMKGFVLAPVLWLTGLPVAAQPQDASQQTGDPVADAARKARESKKDVPKPKKVWTDDDLKKATPETVSTVGTTGTPTTVQTTGNATTGQDQNGEAAWRAKFKDQRDKIARAEKELDILQRELEKAQLQYYPDPQKAMTEQNSRADINDKTAKIDAKKKEIEQLKQGLDDLEDQLRKAGGQPGWAR
jgi:predicted RNase H-like nuclease (RuvC/YqgF family)